MGHVARMGDMKNGHKILSKDLKGKGHSGRPKRRWEDNIRMNLRERPDRLWGPPTLLSNG